MKLKLVLLLLAGLCSALHSAQAQSYSINWYKVAGGGGTSSGGNYSVSGTIGQPDASSTMTGGNYSLTGGFWSLISVIQNPNAPTLYISHSGNFVTVYWQNVSGFTLEQNSSLTNPSGWSASNGVFLSNGTNFLSLSKPTGNQFFQLINPTR